MMESKEKSSADTVDQINQNIESILVFYKREEQKLSRPQRVLE